MSDRFGHLNGALADGFGHHLADLGYHEVADSTGAESAMADSGSDAAHVEAGVAGFYLRRGQDFTGGSIDHLTGQVKLRLFKAAAGASQAEPTASESAAETSRVQTRAVLRHSYEGVGDQVIGSFHLPLAGRFRAGSGLVGTGQGLFIHDAGGGHGTFFPL